MKLDANDYSINSPLYVIVLDGDTLCYFIRKDKDGHPEALPQNVVTDKLDEARNRCSELRANFAGHTYEIHELAFKHVPHFGPDWNGGM